MAKGKTANHTSKELANKAKLATQNASGGSAGAKDRAGGVAGHAKYECPECGMQAPGEKSGMEHWESKHSKKGPFEWEKWANRQEIYGGSTQGVAVLGSKAKQLEKEKADAIAAGKKIGSKKAKGATKRGVS